MRLQSGLLICAAVLIGCKTFAQNTILKSSLDNSLSIKSVAVSPVVDNVSNIYGRPLSSQLMDIVEIDRQWEMIPWNGSTIKPEDLEDQPELVQQALSRLNADALLSTRVNKGPKGITIKMNLLLPFDGQLIAQEILQDYQGFEIKDLGLQLENMYRKIKLQLPYAGMVLSRKNQLVTLNMGSLQGLREGQEVNAIQVIKLNRHPRFKFIVSAEKEIIGRIRLEKVEEALSFGSVVLERTEGVIVPGMKLIPLDFVKYNPIAKDGSGKIIGDLNTRPDSDIAYGDASQKEWVPVSSPTFGRIALMLGLGSYTVSNTLDSVGSVDSTNNFTPSIHVDGELWLTKYWFMAAQLRQYVLSVDNSYSGSSPGSLSLSGTETSMQFGYNFLTSDDFHGPKFQLSGGYAKYMGKIDGSDPVAFTSLDFSGFTIGLGGSFPVSPEMPLTLGARLLYFLTSSVSETPVDSGSGSPQVTKFSAFGVYKWTERMNFRGELLYDLYQSDFSGTGSRGGDSASSASHTLTTITGGLEFLF